jgi:hypothetical protein
MTFNKMKHTFTLVRIIALMADSSPYNLSAQSSVDEKKVFLMKIDAEIDPRTTGIQNWLRRS